ncbi:MAG: hypothetical protein GY799_21735, partial [Desulfobulbaceae bacterium]|nr:hypothetical protein [Desulfobulbaceae bacterium]
LYGSAYNIAAPTFLKLQQEQEKEPAGQIDLATEQSFGDEDDYVDEDLEILVAEEESDLEGEIGFMEEEPADVALSDEDDQEEEGEIEIDFSQFEDADDPEVNLFDEEEIQQEQLGQLPRKMDMPDELSDISDLAPPAQEIEEKEIEEDEQPAGNSADLDFADLDLDDLNFDLGLDGVDDQQTSRAEIPEEAVLALDEIDFAETLAEGSSDSSKTLKTTGMDDDLDFDLDLGGLSIHKDV